MYAIQVHSLEFELAQQGPALRNRNIFLDVSSEGQVPRRYFLGSFSAAERRGYESLVYHASAAVTLRLSNGPFRIHFLGVHTLYDFAAAALKPATRQVVTFGSRGSSPLFHLSYSVAPVAAAYTFSLNEITCLRQLTFQLPLSSGDHLYAEVEFNNSPHQIDRGGTNRYHLGRFNSHQSAPIHSSHNLTFAAISNFVITFYVRNLVSDYILCSFKFIPLDEARHNLRAASLTAPSPSSLSLTLPLGDSSSSSSSPSPSSRSSPSSSTPKGSRSGSSNTSTPPHSPSSTAAPPTTNTNTNPNPNNTTNNTTNTNTNSNRSNRGMAFSSAYAVEELDRVAPRGGLLVRRYDPEGVSEQLALIGEQSKASAQITLSGGDWGAYEMTYSLAKMAASATAQVALPPPLSPSSSSSSTPSNGHGNNGKKGNNGKGANGNAHESASGSGSGSAQNRVEFSRRLMAGEVAASSEVFNQVTVENKVELLIDGRDTYRRMHDVMMAAQHSIRILAWEMSFQVVLAPPSSPSSSPPSPSSSSSPASLSRGVTLEDVLLAKARSGVKVALVVWRHQWLSALDRLLGNLRELAFERELDALKSKATRLGLSLALFYAHSSPPSAAAADPVRQEQDIVVVIAGNPRGITSAHHEKLLLVDAECAQHALAFVGGFDIAKGRYDTARHACERVEGEAEGEGESVPWHDTHVLLQGPAVRLLLLHFLQRWRHSFVNAPHKTRSLDLQLPQAPCPKRNSAPTPLLQTPTGLRNVPIALERTWKGVFDVNYLFDDYKRLIQSAKSFIYVEHQYPFQNFALTYHLCAALKANPKLRVVVVTAVKTDLPSGLVGDLFDWSQDHIMEHLHMIFNTAPDRVGIYGLVTLDPSHRLRAIYVHSKVTIVDDALLVCGSSNMDNVSFFYSSELSVAMHSGAAAKELRTRLFKEHLGAYYPGDSFDAAFAAFKRASADNVDALHNEGVGRIKGLLPSRPVPLTPASEYAFVLHKLDYASLATRLLRRARLDTRSLQRLVQWPSDAARDFVVKNWIVSKL